MDTLAVFRSRSDALRVYKALTKEKIACSTVSTPSRLRLGCGLSVVFPRYLQDRVQSAVNRMQITTFAGFYAR